MLAPNALVATSWPSAPSAAVISRVVVVFPLVPVTSTTCRSAASSLQQVRLQPQAEHAADDRPVTTSGQPGDPAGRAADQGGQPRPERKLSHGG